MKLYTLQECFEIVERKLPFSVIWVNSNGKKYKRTFTRISGISLFSIDDEGFEVRHNLDYPNEEYDISQYLYNRDFKDLVNG